MTKCQSYLEQDKGHTRRILLGGGYIAQWLRACLAYALLYFAFYCCDKHFDRNVSLTGKKGLFLFGLYSYGTVHRPSRQEPAGRTEAEAMEEWPPFTGLLSTQVRTTRSGGALPISLETLISVSKQENPHRLAYRQILLWRDFFPLWFPAPKWLYSLCQVWQKLTSTLNLIPISTSKEVIFLLLPEKNMYISKVTKCFFVTHTNTSWKLVDSCHNLFLPINVSLLHKLSLQVLEYTGSFSTARCWCGIELSGV